MAPVQVFHICDVCGLRVSREDESMRPLRVVYDGHDELYRTEMICQACRTAAMDAFKQALAERKAKC
jgi:hypothetical protein